MMKFPSVKEREDCARWDSGGAGVRRCTEIWLLLQLRDPRSMTMDYLSMGLQHDLWSMLGMAVYLIHVL